MSGSRCRSCGGRSLRPVFDVGLVPLANEYPSSESECESERRFPLSTLVCQTCWLVQLAEAVLPDMLFTDYAYFSSYSDTWSQHAEHFAVSAVEQWNLGAGSLVVEVASNDGYLLKHFHAQGVKVLGVDPAENVAAAAQEAGVPTEVAFFGRAFADVLVKRGDRADLVVANNVLAHVPETNDFVGGLARILAPQGVVSIEFPELSTMLDGAQFDQIYHEHVFYFSLFSCQALLSRHGLRIFDVEHLETHGGSLRVSACHDAADHRSRPSVKAKLSMELERGLSQIETYDAFAAEAEARARSVRRFLDETVATNSKVVAYGAAAKGNTLLNYCSVSSREIAYVVDRSPHKQGRYLPGSHIRISAPDVLRADRPNYVLVLAWNLLGEIVASLPEVAACGGRFVTTMPRLAVLS